MICISSFENSQCFSVRIIYKKAKNKGTDQKKKILIIEFLYALYNQNVKSLG